MVHLPTLKKVDLGHIFREFGSNPDVYMDGSVLGQRINSSQNGEQSTTIHQMYRDKSSSASVQQLAQMSQNEAAAQCSWRVKSSQDQETAFKRDVLPRIPDNLMRPFTLEDQCDTFAQMIAFKLRGLDTKQRLLAEKLINDILFEAAMGNLDVLHTTVSEIVRNQRKQNRNKYLKLFGFIVLSAIGSVLVMVIHWLYLENVMVS